MAIRNAEKRLEECMFGDPIEVMTVVSTILSKIPFDEFISVFDEWKYRLRKSINRRAKLAKLNNSHLSILFARTDFLHLLHFRLL
jgi:hypothetical protein